MAIAEGPTVDEAVRLSHTIEERLKPFLADGTVGSYESILTYVPLAERQQQVIAAVKKQEGAAFDADAHQDDAPQLPWPKTASARRRSPRYLDQMQRFLTPARPITLDDLEHNGLGRIVERFVHRDAQPREDRDLRLHDAIRGGGARRRRGSSRRSRRTIRASSSPGTNVVGRELADLLARFARLGRARPGARWRCCSGSTSGACRLTAIALAQVVAGVL